MFALPLLPSHPSRSPLRFLRCLMWTAGWCTAPQTATSGTWPPSSRAFGLAGLAWLLMLSQHHATRRLPPFHVQLCCAVLCRACESASSSRYLAPLGPRQRAFVLLLLPTAQVACAVWPVEAAGVRDSHLYRGVRLRQCLQGATTRAFAHPCASTASAAGRRPHLSRAVACCLKVCSHGARKLCGAPFAGLLCVLPAAVF